MSPKRINLNADCGESFGAYSLGNDEELLKIVQSANIACGFHAGDPVVMQDTLALCKENGVSVGAHPSYPDLQGFGRRPMRLPLKDVEALIAYQIGALMGMAARVGIEVTHVKPHGAINNQACEDRDLADAICRGMASVSDQLILVAPVLSQLEASGKSEGLRLAGEIFADRSYSDTGSLTPRSQKGAVIKDSQEALDHTLRMLSTRCLHPISGAEPLPCSAQTICIHGDTSHALETAKLLKKALIEADWSLESLPDI